jgi:hypothetical protein
MGDSTDLICCCCSARRSPRATLELSGGVERCCCALERLWASRPASRSRLGQSVRPQDTCHWPLNLPMPGVWKVGAGLRLSGSGAQQPGQRAGARPLRLQRAGRG